MNMKRFRQVLAYIEAHPQEWNQTNPAMCFLAHAARFSGERQLAVVGAGEEWLCIPARHLCPEKDVGRWLFSVARTIDDFRTVARRPFA